MDIAWKFVKLLIHFPALVRGSHAPLSILEQLRFIELLLGTYFSVLRSWQVLTLLNP